MSSLLNPKQVNLSQYLQQKFEKTFFKLYCVCKFSMVGIFLSKDAAFCFSCSIFGKNVKHDTFISTGLTNWTKDLDLF